MKHYDVMLQSGKRVEIPVEDFSQACFEAMLASDGEDCTLILNVGGKDLRKWDLAEGANPNPSDPDEDITLSR